MKQYPFRIASPEGVFTKRHIEKSGLQPQKRSSQTRLQISQQIRHLLMTQARFQPLHHQGSTQ